MADRFITGSREWPRAGGQKWTKWHAYWLPGSATHTLAEQYADALNTTFSDYFAVQPPEWRHATIGAVADRPTWEITDQQRADLHGELRSEFGRVEPFTLFCGPVWTNEHSVILDVRPDEPFQRLQMITEAVITRVLGDDAVYDWRGAGRAHISLAYATGPWCDSGRVASVLRKVTDQIATDVVHRVHILDVTQDAERSWYTWPDPLDVVYLGTGW